MTRSNRNPKVVWGHRLADERGMTLVFVGLGFLGFVAATMLAIDVGMLMTARSQAQNSADAGALAGAVALAFDDYDDRSASGPSVTGAINRAEANEVMGGTVSVNAGDVEFLNDDAGLPNQVRVTVRRTSERGNPLTTFIASIFGMPTADIAAVATAEVSPANGMTCVKPFTIPDRWIENTDPPWDPDKSTFEMFDKKGNLLPDADVYIDARTKATYTGYNTERDRGTRLQIRAGTGTNIEPSMYHSIAIAGITGGAEYDWNIANCNTHVMLWGDLLVQEPGNMVGPTVSGAKLLIDKDPNAYWDMGCNCVQGSTYDGQSPRVFPIPLYDPVYYSEGMRNGRYADLKVANWIGFFLEEVSGNSLYGRIIPIAGIRVATADSPEGVFPIAIRLIH
jgi:Flp pilus assembly protein TadG